jgi:hypothetical protein
MKTHAAPSPIDEANALTARWMRNIKEFDAMEIHPCVVVGHGCLNGEIVEQCEPEDAHFWCVFGHYRTGGVDDLEDFATETEAIAFRDLLLRLYPHLVYGAVAGGAHE